MAHGAAGDPALSGDYLRLLGTPALADVTFCVDGRHIHAHQCVLSARSPFFRLLFSASASASASARPPLSIPVDVVRHDAFLAVLQYLYCGHLLPPAPASCPVAGCSHAHCPFALDLCLETVHAATFLGADHYLLDLLQRRLASMVEHVSLESLMRLLLAAKKQKLPHLWSICSDAVVNSGIPSHVLRRYLPPDVLHELAHSRLQSGGGVVVVPGSYEMPSAYNPDAACHNNEEHRILRLQQALDCMDVELVRLMVMGEGLNLDRAHALHYSVANCNREVVKAVLELGVVDVNYADASGRTALHLAAEMGSADMIAVLLDHHADPNAQTQEGSTALDIVKRLTDITKQQRHPPSGEGPASTKTAAPVPILCTKSDQKRVHLCIELLHSAAAVVNREEAECSSCVTSHHINTAHRPREEFVAAETQAQAGYSTSSHLINIHNSPAAPSPRMTFFCSDQQTNHGSLLCPDHMDPHLSVDVNNYTANSTSLSS